MADDKKKKVARSQTLVREIETYRAHCLFAEARKRAVELANLILANERLKEKKKLLMAVVDKIEAIEEEAEAFSTVGKDVRISNAERRRIQKVFASAFEEGSDPSAFEGAVALMVFGQFGPALVEFEKLLKSREFGVPAAKNIIRCLLGLGSPKRAIQRYLNWLSEKRFDSRQLEIIRAFLQRALDRKGIAKKLPAPKIPEPAAEEPPPIELTLDLLSVVITVQDDRGNEKKYALDVNFQRGKTISLIVEKKERELLRHLKPGRTLKDVLFDSASVQYVASCVVYGNSPIRVGEKRGDHTVTLKLTDR